MGVEELCIDSKNNNAAMPERLFPVTMKLTSKIDVSHGFPTQVFPRCIQRLPESAHGRRRRGKNHLLHRSSLKLERNLEAYVDGHGGKGKSEGKIWQI
ncbi:hypothetical protein Tco_0392594 [Tanacetum coccineum]